jgi:hypothetical protein
LFGELSSRASEAKEGMNIGSLVRSRSRSGAEAQVKRKSERATDSGNAADDVGPINGAAVPSVGSSVGGFNKDNVGATIVGGNGDSFVEEAVKMFDCNSFVVAASSDVYIDM